MIKSSYVREKSNTLFQVASALWIQSPSLSAAPTIVAIEMRHVTELKSDSDLLNKVPERKSVALIQKSSDARNIMPVWCFT